MQISYYGPRIPENFNSCFYFYLIVYPLSTVLPVVASAFFLYPMIVMFFPSLKNFTDSSLQEGAPGLPLNNFFLSVEIADL